MVLVEAHAGDRVGLGYTYGDAATGALVRDTLAEVVEGRDALAVTASWQALGRACRNLGRPGLASMAIAAVDTALWDLKARLLELPLATLLDAAHEAVPIYGSGGFTSYSGRAARGAARRLGRAGHPAREDEGRPRAGARPAAGRGGARGDRRARRSSSWTRTAPSAAKRRCGSPSSTRSASTCAGSRSRSARTTWKACACSATGRRPGWRSPPASTATCCPTSSGCSRRARSTACRPTSLAARGSPASCASGALCQARSLQLSAHCGPVDPCPSLLRGRAAAPPRVLPRPRPDRAALLRRRPRARRRRAAPDLSRPGNGLELKRADAERYAI